MQYLAKSNQLAGKIIEGIQAWQHEYASEDGLILNRNLPFQLPGGQVHRVDAGWIGYHGNETGQPITANQPPVICPAFVVNFSSPEPRELEAAQVDMTRFRDSGCALGWLIEPENEQVLIYQPHEPVHQVATFDYYLDGRSVLKGFEFPLKKLRL